MTQSAKGVSRRNFLETSLASSAIVAGVGTATNSASAAEPAARTLAVYTGAMSCLPGDQLALHVSTDLPTFSAKITRVGAKPTVVWQQEGLKAEKHPVPADASMKGCNWPAALSVPIGKDWRSGIYLLQLQGEGAATDSFFIVRSAQPGKQAKILLQVATNTYQAYNAWGGSSLYSGPKYPRVSFNRPFNITQPVTTPVEGFYNPNDACYRTWDEPLIIWAEESGYEIDYCANLDLEFQPEMLKQYRLVLSNGHDEYWSAGMRDNLEAFIAGGGNVAFLSGNTICWQIRVENDGRELVCYKRANSHDPVFATDDLSNLSSLWCDPLVKRPENQLSGVGFLFGGYNGFFGEYVKGPGAGEYTVHQPDHWLFAGTGLKRGETFGRLVPRGPQPGIAGYECDGCEIIWNDGVPKATGRDGTPTNFNVLATAPAKWSATDGSLGWVHEIRKALPPPPEGMTIPDDYVTRPGAAVFGVYERGGTVVTTGSCGWSYGLQARMHVVDRIVRNLLDRLSA